MKRVGDQDYEMNKRYPSEITEDLRENVVAAVQGLIQQIVNDQRNLPVLGALGQEVVYALFEECLHLLYRLLFVLYAEEHNLLPVAESSLYRNTYSMEHLRELARQPLNPDEADETYFIDTLRALFKILHEGSPSPDSDIDLGFRIPPFDGQLFDPQSTCLLNRCDIPNQTMREVIHALSFYCHNGREEPYSYADLEIELLGSIYESLLDFTPYLRQTEAEDGEASGPTVLLSPKGSKRKTTGAYYTHPSLVDELIKGALAPVVRERLAEAGLPVLENNSACAVSAALLIDCANLSEEQRATGEGALLSIRVCDPAAGSGHFLLKANNVLATTLAQIRTGKIHPSEAAVQAAKLDVLTHCIYGVDVNPMAVELCKVGLWINASVRERPLSFLDHHIKCGNSLVGATPELMSKGIPYQAFDQNLVGNDRATTNSVRKRNRAEKASESSPEWKVTVISTQEDLDRWRWLNRAAEEQPQIAHESYVEYLTSEEYRWRKTEADFWTAAFYWPLPEGVEWTPTHQEFRRLQEKGPDGLPSRILAQIEELTEQYRFFHWHLEFPDVFAEDGRGGFDVVLGNPPWERIKLREKEFFAVRAPEIANAPTAAQRRVLIDQLSQGNPILAAQYSSALRRSESEICFICNSNRYPLTGKGDVNTYAVFVELTLSILSRQGRVGLVVPSGIATDFTYQEFFDKITNHGKLVSFWDFENREGLFPGTHRSYKFALMILTDQRVPAADFSFFLRSVADLNNRERHFTLTEEDLALFNPNTHTCPVFRSRRDVGLTRKIYSVCPVWVNKGLGSSPWGVSFLRMLDMTNDSDLFHTKHQLLAQGAQLPANMIVRRNGQEFWPLYEGRMIHHFDHRTASVGTNSEVTFRSGITMGTSPIEHKDPQFRPQPRYWVEHAHVLSSIPETYAREWFVGFKDVTGPTNERTLICTVIPRTAVGNKIPLILTNHPARKVCCLVANLSSFVLDYVTRQKMGGITLNLYIMEQLPVISPEQYTSDLLALIVPRVLELTYTAWDLQPFARDLEYQGAPFSWNEQRRAVLRAELDAIYAHLYGLSRAELAHILKTFPIVRRRDTRRFGRYRTLELILNHYDEFSNIARISSRSK